MKKTLFAIGIIICVGVLLAFLFRNQKNSDSGKSPEQVVPNSINETTGEFISATNTPITLLNFSFVLDPGRYVAYDFDGRGVFIAKDKDSVGFVINCPPPGKGLEAATRLSSENRLFTNGSSTYSVSFEKWTAPKNDPWMFVWLRKGSDKNSPDVVCTAQGSTDPEIMKEMKMLYQTLK